MNLNLITKGKDSWIQSRNRAKDVKQKIEHE